MNELPCIVCGKELEPATPKPLDTDTNQPWGANVFISRGHYGATAFDTGHDDFLEVNICTYCLEDAAGKGHVFYVVPSHAPRPPATYKLWNPEKTD